MRGRRPDPAAVREQKAAVRSTREKPAATAPAAPVAAGDPPKWLKDEGLAIWHRLAPTLRLAKLLSTADGEAFARYCRNFARWLKMQRVLDDEGETYETETYLAVGGEAPKGGDAAPARANKLKRAHPAYLIGDRLEKQLLAAEDRFGLNPAMRQRIFAARAQTGTTGDLFPTPERTPRDGDPAAKPAQPSVPVGSAVGFLTDEPQGHA